MWFEAAMVGAALMLVLMAASGEPSPAPDDIERFRSVVARIVAGEGPLLALSETQRAAVEALFLEPEARARGWSPRARTRGWLPRVDMRVGTDTDLDIRDVGGVDERWTEGRGFGADLGLRWSLGDVVFADVELRVNRERLARASARRLALERVTKLYFQRLEVELALRGAPAPKLVLEAARLDGLLDALTDGHWSKRSVTRAQTDARRSL